MAKPWLNPWIFPILPAIYRFRIVRNIYRLIYSLSEEIIVAKRRNLKKEKAERNQAYARQFRQKTTRFSRNSRFGAGKKREENSAEDTE
jgi:hypothetical protein